MTEKVLTLTQADFESNVLKNVLPVLVDFWASWCGPCKMIAPIVEEIANENVGKIVVGKLNVDEQSAVASQYSVMSIPTLILFKGGKVVNKSIGAVSKERLQDFIDKNI